MKKKRLLYHMYGNERRGYRQKRFELSTFDISGVSREEVSEEDVNTVIHNLKQLGLTQVELGHAHHNTVMRALAACEKEGLNLILQDLSRFGGFQNRDHVDITEDDVKTITEEMQKYRCVTGYYVWDEPWLNPDIEAAAKQVEWFDRYAPDKLGLVAANPSYNPDYTWENALYPYYIDKFCNTIQPSVLSMDFYPFSGDGSSFNDEEQLDNSDVWKDLAVSKLASTEQKLPFWFYYQVIRMHKGPELTFPMIRLQMNYALLYGAKALQCYGVAGSMCSPHKMDEKRRILQSDFTEGCFFDDYKQQIAKIKEWGKTFIALKSDHVYHSPEVLENDVYFNEHFREDVTESLLDVNELPFRCSVGVLSDGYGNQYIGILNRDYERAQSFVLPLKDTYRVYEVSYADGKQYCINEGTNCLNVTLAEGDMVVYRLQDCKEEAFEIEYVCEEL